LSLGFALTLPAPGDPTPADVLAGIRQFLTNTARPDGSFAPGTNPEYPGMSDSAYSDVAPTVYAVILHTTFGWKLPRETRTGEWLLTRQQSDGAFVNFTGTADPKSAQARAYNTTMALVALRALGLKPRHDPLPVFASVLKEDYKHMPLYMTSFFPLAHLAVGAQIPPAADRKIRDLMAQGEDGYINEHVASTFHAVHYYRLIGAEVPKADEIVKRVLADQNANGSWFINPPARDRHATFDAVFTLHQLGGDQPKVQSAKRRSAGWALTCRNTDGGFGHFPGSASDMDAVYFQMGTLVLTGWLKPIDPLPSDPHLLGWGHLMPVPKSPSRK